MTIPEIADAINKQALNYKIGKLQEIRKKLKGLERQAGSLIFDSRYVNDDWGFHYGGRTEIQFNIGLEDEGVRYGLAFSLEPSQALPDITILYPKILKLNCLIREEPETFKDYYMWFWQNGKRSNIQIVTQVEKEQIQPKTFIFFGKIVTEDKININNILRTFDKLLLIYLAIESNDLPSPTIANETKIEFVFERKYKSLPKGTSYSSIEREINVDARHSFLQDLLRNSLEKDYGEENVSVENYCRGNRIDIVLRVGKEYHFYEVKVASSAKSCIRQAMGQIFEYAFGDCKRDATQIVIAGESKIDTETSNYLNYLRNEFNIPICYLTVPQ